MIVRRRARSAERDAVVDVAVAVVVEAVADLREGGVARAVEHAGRARDRALLLHSPTSLPQTPPTPGAAVVVDRPVAVVVQARRTSQAGPRRVLTDPPAGAVHERAVIVRRRESRCPHRRAWGGHHSKARNVQQRQIVPASVLSCGGRPSGGSSGVPSRCVVDAVAGLGLRAGCRPGTRARRSRTRHAGRARRLVHAARTVTPKAPLVGLSVAVVVDAVAGSSVLDEAEAVRRKQHLRAHLALAVAAVDEVVGLTNGTAMVSARRCRPCRHQLLSGRRHLPGPGDRRTSTVRAGARESAVVCGSRGAPFPLRRAPAADTSFEVRGTSSSSRVVPAAVLPTGGPSASASSVCPSQSLSTPSHLVLRGDRAR